MASTRDALDANDFLYRVALGEISWLHERGAPSLVEAVERAARLAWFYHPGRFADGALENLLLDVGRTLCAEGQATHGAAPSGPRALHVATTLYPTGGHGRILTAWLERDRDIDHELVLTRQVDPVPGPLLETCRARGVELTVLDPKLAPEERARALRSRARSATQIFLHHNPDDAVPVLAFAARGGPPVVMFNHAHFSFSLGTSVSDLVLSTMPYFEALARERRFARRTRLVPASAFERIDRTAVDKRAAKKALGLAETDPVVLSIGNEGYYKPARGQDFFATLEKLMALRSGFLTVFVGIGPKSTLVPKWVRQSERIRLVGRVDDPHPYYRAADISLESFPTPSLGGLWESMAIGEAYPIPAYAPREGVLRPCFNERIGRTNSEGAYLEEVCRRLDHPEETAAEAAKERSSFLAIVDGVEEQLADLHSEVARLRHEPQPLPVTDRSDAPDDLSLADSSQDDVGDHLLGLCIHAPHRALRPHATAARSGYEPYGRALLRMGWVLLRSARRLAGRLIPI